MHKFVTKCTMNTLLSTRKAFVFASLFVECKVCVFASITYHERHFKEFDAPAAAAAACCCCLLLFYLDFFFAAHCLANVWRFILLFLFMHLFYRESIPLLFP